MPVRKTDFLKSRKYFPNQLELPPQHPDEQEKNTSCVSASASTPIASLITVLPGRPPVSIFLKEPGNCCPAAECNHLRFTSEHGVPRSADSRGNTDNERKEQLLYIQKPLNLREEYDKRDNIQSKSSVAALECYPISVLHFYSFYLRVLNMFFLVCDFISVLSFIIC